MGALANRVPSPVITAGRDERGRVEISIMHDRHSGRQVADPDREGEAIVWQVLEWLGERSALAGR